MTLKNQLINKTWQTSLSLNYARYEGKNSRHLKVINQ